MECRPGCGACCTAPSISSPIPGMPHGKPAGVRCVQLDEQDRCRIFDHPDRPAVCRSLKPHPTMCHDSREAAMRWLTWLEQQTGPLGTPTAGTSTADTHDRRASPPPRI